MKCYVVYRRMTKAEIKKAMENGEPIPEDRMQVYAFTVSKKIAKEFMRIHSDKVFDMRKEKFSDEEYYDFLEDHQEDNLYMVKLRDRVNTISVPMKEAEESEIETFYYDEAISMLPEPFIGCIVPSCRIFGKKYQRVLDLLGTSKAVCKARYRQLDDDEAADKDFEIDTYDAGECGFKSPGMSSNSLNIYINIYADVLRERKGK